MDTEEQLIERLTAMNAKLFQSVAGCTQEQYREARHIETYNELVNSTCDFFENIEHIRTIERFDSIANPLFEALQTLADEANDEIKTAVERFLPEIETRKDTFHTWYNELSSPQKENLKKAQHAEDFLLRIHTLATDQNAFNKVADSALNDLDFSKENNHELRKIINQAKDHWPQLTFGYNVKLQGHKMEAELNALFKSIENTP